MPTMPKSAEGFKFILVTVFMAIRTKVAVSTMPLDSGVCDHSGSSSWRSWCSWRLALSPKLELMGGAVEIRG
jgi:hypothetical protein